MSCPTYNYITLILIRGARSAKFIRTLFCLHLPVDIVSPVTTNATTADTVATINNALNHKEALDTATAANITITTTSTIMTDTTQLP